jgi:uncharacterized protein with FMN-binding domain
MKRASAAVVATIVGLFWVLTFKVTPHPAGRPAAASPRPSPSAGQPLSAAPTPTASTPAASTPSPTPVSSGHDGTFTGTDVPTIYGDVQVRIVVAGGRVSDVRALLLPSDRARSAEISQFAGPALRSEAIQAQSANVDVVSGATYTSEAYAESLNAALQQAHLA